ncbi:MAG: VOC family protein [Bacteroidetes bacterium]|nr:VOC family protein [Bacteroidota bacterium]
MSHLKGIGGIFFKSPDPKKLAVWYASAFDLTVSEYGTFDFNWRESDGSPQERLTLFSPFKESTTYFKPSESSFMVNFIVDDLEALLADLEKKEIPVLPERENADYGRFAWMMDPDGNKIELWQPALKK